MEYINPDRSKTQQALLQAQIVSIKTMLKEAGISNDHTKYLNSLLSKREKELINLEIDRKN